jgi:hypothetical protein
MMYSGLFKELNLSAEEKEKLKAILTDQQMQNIDMAKGMFGNQKESTDDNKQKFEDTKKQTEADIKALLGEDRFAQYEDYQKNLGERMQLNQFKNPVAGTEPPAG